MRKFALIGALVLLIVPFSYISAEGPGYDYTTSLGFFYTSTEGNFLIFDLSGSESFQTSWFEDNGYYENVFGDLWIIAMVALLIAIFALVFAVIDGMKQKRSIYFVVLASLLVLVLRFFQLNEADLSFYKTWTSILGDSTYLEIPLGPILAIMLGFVGMSRRD